MKKNFYDSKGIEVVSRDIIKNNSSDKMEYKVKYVLKGEIGVDYEVFVN